MANPEHLAILKQGVAAWARWRAKNQQASVNLSGANLSKACLGLVNLDGANLGGATLDRADLSRAYLSKANLGGANLGNAYLSGADLGGANLSRAYLGGANLTGAYIGEAVIGYTSFADVDLSRVNGLESVKHRGPSTIGIDTIYRSRGKIHPEFLRGCGVPEDFITYMRSLVNNPIEYYSCFISYNSKDEECARRLYADLQAANVRCWFAPHDLKIGDDILDRIDETIRARDKLLLILSHNSIQSYWVETEVKTAFEEERRRKKSVLFPVRLDDAVMDTQEPWAAQLRRKHIGDFTRWKDHDAYQAALDRLLRDLKASAQA